MTTRSSKGHTKLTLIPGGAGKPKVGPDDETIIVGSGGPPEETPGQGATEGTNAGIEVSFDREPRVGDVISGRYALQKVLGEGGMGRVFLAIDQLYAEGYGDRHAEVALKFLGERFAAHADARIALQRETHKSQQLSHPNVVRVMHFDQHGPHAYMIMECVHGSVLDEFVRDHAPTGLDFDAAFPLIEGMGNGLAYIHEQGLVHLDFKPNNVLIENGKVAKVMDLGIARVREDEFQASGGTSTRFDAGSLGALTPEYASCEMFESMPPDPRDDVYALACCAYELLAGHHPFNGAWSIKARSAGLKPQRIPGLNQRRWHALEQALAFDRAQRVPSAEEFIERIRDSRARRKLLIGGLSGAAVVAAAAATYFAMVGQQAPDPDALFLEQFAEGRPSTLDAEAQRRVTRSLTMGQQWIEFARGTIESDEFGTGNAISSAHADLSGAADNAYDALDFLLSTTANEAADEAMLSIFDSYAEGARRAAEVGDVADGLWFACKGLAKHERHVRLNEVAAKLSSRLPPGTSNCIELGALTNPPSIGEG